MSKYTIALIIGVPAWVAFSMIIYNALTSTYGRDSPAMLLAPVCAALIGFAMGAAATKILK